MIRRSTPRRLGAWVLAVTLAAVPLPARAGPDQELYARGRDAVFAERWPEARQALDELIRRYPDSSHADDAHYWLGMALYEMSEPDRAYLTLKQMQGRFPESPWNDDARALMVRCAEAALLARPASRSAEGGDRPRRDEYEAFLDRSTKDSSSKVQLLAIDTVLGARPGKAAELLPRLSSGQASPQAAGMVLDRFFGGERVKVTMEHPSQGFTEGNVAVMVRRGDSVSHLGLSEALELVRPGSRRDSRFDAATVSQIRDKLIRAEKGLMETGGPGSIESAPDDRSMSAIVKVVDGEVHYYRNGEETTRIVVLRRQAGFHAGNVRVFLENPGGIRELPLETARGLNPGGALDVSEATVRYLKAALAIIEIDLTRSDATDGSVKP
jgi:hypothetical protein